MGSPNSVICHPNSTCHSPQHCRHFIVSKKWLITKHCRHGIVGWWTSCMLWRFLMRSRLPPTELVEMRGPGT